MKALIAEKIRRSRRTAISSHVRPDADSIGSGLALYLMLRQMGKEVAFFNADPAPSPLDRLPGYGHIRIGQIHPRPFDLVLLIEGGSEERSGQRGLSGYFCVNIDHHASGGDADTGSFKYSNTTPVSLAIAADLARRGGFAPFEVSNLLFNSNPREKILMLTRVLSTLEMSLEGRVAMIDFRRDFLERLTLKEIETEDIIAIARSIDGVRVVLFFKEIADDYYRVSIRSRGEFSARQVAQAFQGGGHQHAAGFFYRGGLAAAKREIMELISGQLR
jgi:phosphoesterase RecJ-like protein